MRPGFSTTKSNESFPGRETTATELENLKPGKASTTSKEPSGRSGWHVERSVCHALCGACFQQAKGDRQKNPLPQKEKCTAVNLPQAHHTMVPWPHAWCMSFCWENSAGVYLMRLVSQPSRKTWTSRSLDNRGPGVDLPCSTCSFRSDSKARARAG